MSNRGLAGPVALVVLGTALSGAGLAVLLWPGDQVAAEVGSVLVTPAPVETTATGGPVTAATSPPAQDPAGFVPGLLTIGAVGIEAPLVATLVDTRGALVPPDDPAQLGWWRGVRPGEGAGSVLVAGHLDSARYGRGPLARIVDLDPGDLAVVSGPAGTSATYAVRGVQTFPKDSLPADALFGTGGPERLVLVTCGGAYDRDNGGWDSNVVAVLDPVAPG